MRIFAAAALLSMAAAGDARATSGGTPYETPEVVSSGGRLEVTIVAEMNMVNLGNGVSAMMETFNATGVPGMGAVPGPTLRLQVNDTVIVRLINQLPDHQVGIHWHGIELDNYSDGTP